MSDMSEQEEDRVLIDFPTPWKVMEPGCIYDADMWKICEVYGSHSDSELAHLIVDAVNSIGAARARIAELEALHAPTGGVEMTIGFSPDADATASGGTGTTGDMSVAYKDSTSATNGPTLTITGPPRPQVDPNVLLGDLVRKLQHQNRILDIKYMYWRSIGVTWCIAALFMLVLLFWSAHERDKLAANGTKKYCPACGQLKATTEAPENALDTAHR